MCFFGKLVSMHVAIGKYGILDYKICDVKQTLNLKTNIQIHLMLLSPSHFIDQFKISVAFVGW